MALVKKTYQLQAEKESLKSHIKLTQANVDGLILENDALEDEIQRLKEVIRYAVKRLRHHHSVRGGINIICDRLEQALKEGEL